jgi:ribosomal-protein-alanine N-acetyltransferase
MEAASCICAFDPFDFFRRGVFAAPAQASGPRHRRPVAIRFDVRRRMLHERSRLARADHGADGQVSKRALPKAWRGRSPRRRSIVRDRDGALDDRASRAPNAPTFANARSPMKARIRLDRLSRGDEAEFISAALRSRALHRPWVAPATTPAAFQAYVARMAEPGQKAFAIRRRDDGALVGIVTISNVVMGAFRSAYTGYYAFAPHAGHGYLREGLQAAVDHAFRTMKLHRLEANIQPGNRASIALAKACGFRKEGFSPRYLKIGGRWRDHERWALLHPRDVPAKAGIQRLRRA